MHVHAYVYVFSLYVPAVDPGWRVYSRERSHTGSIQLGVSGQYTPSIHIYTDVSVGREKEKD